MSAGFDVHAKTSNGVPFVVKNPMASTTIDIGDEEDRDVTVSVPVPTTGIQRLRGQTMLSAEVSSRGSEDFIEREFESQYGFISSHTAAFSYSRTATGLAVSAQSEYNTSTEMVDAMCQQELYDNWEYAFRREYKTYCDVDATSIQYPILMRNLSILVHPYTRYFLRFLLLWDLLGFIAAVNNCRHVVSNDDNSVNPTYIFNIYLSLQQVLTTELLTYVWYRPSFAIRFSGKVAPVMLTYRQYLSLLINAVASNNSMNFGKYGQRLPARDFKVAYWAVSLVIVIVLVTFYGASVTAVMNTSMREYDSSQTECTEQYWQYYTAIGLPGNWIFIITTVLVAHVIFLLLITCTILHFFMLTWLDRVTCLRLLRISALEFFRIPGTSSKPERPLSSRILRRDAYERYLFILVFVRKISRYWGKPLGILFVTAFVVVAVSIFFLATSAFKGNSNFLGIFISYITMPTVLILVICPLACAVYCNHANNKIRQAFLHCTPRPFTNLVLQAPYGKASDEDNSEDERRKARKSWKPKPERRAQRTQSLDAAMPKSMEEALGSEYDYEVIGGREEWLAFTEQNPLHFTVFGLGVTARFLVQAIVAALSTGLTTAFIVFSRQSRVFR